MTQDPISDFFARIKNAYLAHADTVSAPYSKMNHSLAGILKNQGYLGKVEVKDGRFKTLVMNLLYQNKEARLTDIKMVSKPGRKVYAKKDRLPRVLNGLGFAIISTPAGLMTDRMARKAATGGEVICKIW